MNRTIKGLRSFIDEKKGERNTLLKHLHHCEQMTDTAGRLHNEYEEAKLIINAVAQQTQDELRYHISELIDLPLQAIFEDDAYSFGIEFPIKRDKTECELFFKKKGQKISPMKASEGGAVDVASFALRPAILSLKDKHNKLRPTILLDEPFKFLSDDFQQRAGEMLSEISKKLGIQFIMITHIKKLIESADNVIVTRKKGKMTKVKNIKVKEE